MIGYLAWMAIHLWAPASPGPLAPDSLVLSCQAFPDTISRATLVKRYGAANVVDDSVPVGEGDFAPGTVLFPGDSLRRLELRWNSSRPGARLLGIQVYGPTLWHTPQRLTTGLQLAAVERLNGRPFRMTGYGADGDGGVRSWSGGHLAAADAPRCRAWARFAPAEDRMSLPLVRQVFGGHREYSSGHPGMQASGSHVIAIGITWENSGT